MHSTQKKVATAKSFVIYHDFYDTVSELTNDEMGELFHAVFNWQLTGEIIDVSPILKLTLKTLIAQFKRDGDNYKKTCLRNSENAKKRWEQSNNKKKRPHTTAYDRKRVDAKHAYSNNDNDNDIHKEAFKNAEYKKFLERFNEATGKKHRSISAKLVGQYFARLKDGYTEDDIINATINCKNTEYHQQSNLKYLTPEFITRTDKLDTYTQKCADESFQPFTHNGTRWDGEPLCNGLTRHEFIEKFGRIS